MNCKLCGEKITNKRNKEYCNKSCRNRAIAKNREQDSNNNPN